MERRQGTRLDPAFTRMIGLIPNNSGNHDRTCPDTSPQPGPGCRDTPPKPGPHLSGYSIEAGSSAIFGLRDVTAKHQAAFVVAITVVVVNA